MNFIWQSCFDLENRKNKCENLLQKLKNVLQSGRNGLNIKKLGFTVHWTKVFTVGSFTLLQHPIRQVDPSSSNSSLFVLILIILFITRDATKRCQALSAEIWRLQSSWKVHKISWSDLESLRGVWLAIVLSINFNSQFVLFIFYEKLLSVTRRIWFTILYYVKGGKKLIRAKHLLYINMKLIC